MNSPSIIEVNCPNCNKSFSVFRIKMFSNKYSFIVCPLCKTIDTPGNFLIENNQS